MTEETQRAMAEAVAEQLSIRRPVTRHAAQDKTGRAHVEYSVAYWDTERNIGFTIVSREHGLHAYLEATTAPDALDKARFIGSVFAQVLGILANDVTPD